MDIGVNYHGSITSLTPLTDAGQRWIDENVESEGWQWMGNSLSVDHRMAQAVIDGALEDGLELNV